MDRREIVIQAACVEAMAFAHEKGLGGPAAMAAAARTACATASRILNAPVAETEVRQALRELKARKAFAPR